MHIWYSDYDLIFLKYQKFKWSYTVGDENQQFENGESSLFTNENFHAQENYL